MKRMMRDHPGVLQNIEFTLVTTYREDRSIDDCIVLDALRAALEGDVPTEARRELLVDRLRDMREFRSDTPDNVWQDCLRVVMQSVRRHSSLTPGSTGYLGFISNFIF